MQIAKKQQYRANAFITVLVMLGILVILNVLAQNWFYRIDLTEEKRYSLSPASKSVVQNLEDIVTIKVFINSDVPQFQGLFRYIQDFLEEYRSQSGGKLDFSLVDPGKDADVKTEALQLGIVPAQLSVRSSEGASVREIYSGMAVYYHERVEVIDQIFNTDLEYDLTRTINKITREEIPLIGFVTGHNEYDISGDYSSLGDEFQKSYNVEPIILGDSELDPSRYQVVVVPGPKSDLTSLELYRLDQYLMKGGKIIILMDTVTETGDVLQLVHSNIQDLAAQYGVQYHSALIVDPEKNFAQPLNQLFSRPTPWVPQVTELIDHPITRKVNVMYAPLSGYLTGSEGATNIVDLAKTSSTSWAETDQDSIASGQLNQDIGVDPVGPLTVASVGSGPFTSYYKDHPLPEGIKKDTVITISTPDARILIVGNGQFLTNNNLKELPGSFAFISNSAEWFITGSDIASIQAHVLKERPLKEISGAGREWIRYLNILGMAVIVIGVGFARWIIRRRRKKAYLNVT